MNRVADFIKRRRSPTPTCEEHTVTASGAGMGLERQECARCGTLTIGAVDWVPSEKFRRYVESNRDREA